MPPRRSNKTRHLLVAAAAMALVFLPAAGATPGTTTLVSRSSGGIQSNGRSVEPAISGDGRFVAFRSDATNLVPGDTNGGNDIFVHDRQTGATSRVNVASDGAQATSSSPHSTDPAISSDGRFVAFESSAANLVPGDGNLRVDVFVHDRATGVTSRVSVSSNGDEANDESHDASLSADGRFVAFASEAGNLVTTDANLHQDIFVHDRSTGTTTQVNVNSAGEGANRHSLRPVISPDGRYVAFESNASNLVAGEPSGLAEIFLHDRVSGETTVESVATGGTRANDNSLLAAVDEGAKHVAFASWASNLVPGDTNDAIDVFLRDRASGETRRLSVGLHGPETPEHSVSPTISADGHFVAYGSEAPNLVPGDTNGVLDGFRYDLETGTTERLTVGTLGEQANASNEVPALSANGHFVAFPSSATNLVSGDANVFVDLFVRDLTPATPAPPPPPPPLPPPVPAPPPPPAAAAPPQHPPARCRVPRVIGLRLVSARVKIRRAKCAVGRIRRAPSRLTGRVIRQTPRPGAVVRPRTRVNLVVGRR